MLFVNGEEINAVQCSSTFTEDSQIILVALLLAYPTQAILRVTRKCCGKI